MGKLMFWIVVVFVALLVLRVINAAQAKKRHQADPRRPAAAVPMVQCARCGVYLPRADARADGGGFRCAEACAPRR